MPRRPNFYPQTIDGPRRLAELRDLRDNMKPLISRIEEIEATTGKRLKTLPVHYKTYNEVLFQIARIERKPVDLNDLY